ncbi:helix-turn-helix transcriptional regulator [Variovorax paradoxus]|jgi:DNA-binding CsgD family transcriptional regulator|uniref:helix-turn-helix transcriptional regulator n=1 Tax=Variovorax paradoxus TaxID=34073 RepID=UPI0029C7E71C|nr:AAA family ATPase [Variovorax paradoxus]WPH18996.1 AAA family ATPase [Variovorax paradoxus]
MAALDRIGCHRCGRVRLHADAPCPACGAAPAARAAVAGANEPFVGRRGELQLAHDALGGALAGRGRVVMLSGEAGIGKTRLAQEVATLALRRGMLTLWGRCLEEPGAPPFLPWTRAMQACLRACRDERLPALLGREAAAAVEIAPELAGRLPPGTAVPAIGEGDQARFRLFAAVAHFWRQVATLRPLLLILDNLHWADASSLRLLAFIAQDVGESRILLLGSYREAGLSRQHPLAATLAELLNTRQFCRLPLQGLSLDETERMVAAASAVTPPPAVIATMHRRTEGNPLYLVETLRFLQQGHCGNDPRATAARAETVPSGIRAVIGRRLDQLSAPCCELLAIAACIGRDFDLPLLAELAGTGSEAALLGRLDEALAQRVIEAVPPGPQYQFSHVLIREVLYDELPAARRVALHARIAESLEARHAGRLDAVLAQLAYHAAAALPAGNAARALDIAQQAAARAVALMAHEEALRCYRLALQLQERWLPAERARHGALLLALGAVQTHAGENDGSAATFLEAATLARALGDADLFAQAALGFENNGWRISRPGEQAAALLEEALADADGFDAALRVDLLAALCRACIFCGRQPQANAAQRHAVALARELAMPQPLFKALAAILPARADPTQLDERLRCAREALEVAERAGHMEWVDALTGWYFGDLVEKGELAAARPLAQVHVRVADAIRQPFMQAMGLASLTLLAAYEGRFADAERLAGETFTIGQRFLPGNAQGAYSLQIFVLRRHQGRLGEVLPVLRGLVGSVPRDSLWQPGLALICTELDLHEPAREAYEALAADGFAGIARDGMWLTNIVFAAEVCARLGDRPRAALLYRLLAPYAGRNVVTGTNIACFGAVDRYRGMLAALAGDDANAAVHLEAAVALDERCGGRPWLAYSRFEWARWLAARGDAAAAGTQLDAALALGRELGMASLARRCEARQRELAGAGAVPSASPDGLSRRELAVLRLLCAGCSNQAIAERLFISPHTVAHHVRHILSKTDCRSRTEAATWAHRHRVAAEGLEQS